MSRPLPASAPPVSPSPVRPSPVSARLVSARLVSARLVSALLLPALLLAAFLVAPPASGQTVSRGLPGGSPDVTTRRALTPYGGAAAATPRPSPAPDMDLDAVAPCVLGARPDMARALACYAPLLQRCQAAEPQGEAAVLACLRADAVQWQALAARYGAQPGAGGAGFRPDPALCDRLAAAPLPGAPATGASPESLRLQCRIAAEAQSAIQGHVASLWGGLR